MIYSPFTDEEIGLKKHDSHPQSTRACALPWRPGGSNGPTFNHAPCFLFSVVKAVHMAELAGSYASKPLGSDTQVYSAEPTHHERMDRMGRRNRWAGISKGNVCVQKINFPKSSSLHSFTPELYNIPICCPNHLYPHF